MEVVGSVVGGNNAALVIREKKGAELELGELVVVESEAKKYIFMVSAMEFGTLLEEGRLLTSAGSMVEGTRPRIEFPEDDLRIFRKVRITPLVEISKVDGSYRAPRSMPHFLSPAKRASSEDFSFLKRPRNEIFLGKLRSGGSVLDFDYYMDGEQMLSHHTLIAAQTGRGKSNLVKVMLWEIMNHGKFGMLVLDVHNEYFGSGANKGLKNHPKADRNLVYYSKSPPPGQKKLKVSLRTIDPEDLLGILELSPAQEGALQLYRREFSHDWIKELMREDPQREKEYERKGVQGVTIRSLRRKLGNLFKIRCAMEGEEPCCEDDVFDLEGFGESTIKDIADALERGRVVIIDGSSISDDTGLVIMSAVMREVFRRYEGYKDEGTLQERVQVGVILEEAPRVLGELYGGNIFGRITREGRKFKIGLVAVTQMVSVIPDEILANIGTKIIMGNEMARERQRLIESSPQDLSQYEQVIAGLEKGESIVSSIFSKFPVPIYTPLFEELVKTGEAAKGTESVFY
ncbi:MAG: ATP-binding protein [Candidatus Methanomethylicia archaeon]|jgi:DNA helicase HerA-like ATPase|nr:ATP-binding protein [Candidatus Methanomethylicia archaeon]